MFGHQDDQSQQQNSNHISDQSIDAAMSSDTSQAPSAPPAPQTVQPATAPPPAGDSLESGADDSPDDRLTTGTLNSSLAPSTPSQSDDTTTTDDTTNTNELIDIKQQALTQLSPLVGHLDQTPEEKFRTTMMMIQASDDQSLIKVAYEAAQGIADEKSRAQALLDIVNEINYFTQHHDSGQS